MKATHTDYKHPRHLRAVDGDRVLCVSPSSSDFAALTKATLWRWRGEGAAAAV